MKKQAASLFLCVLFLFSMLGGVGSLAAPTTAQATPAAFDVTLDGDVIPVAKFAISGNTYMRLVDITNAFDCYTWFDADKRVAHIETDKSAVIDPNAVLVTLDGTVPVTLADTFTVALDGTTIPVTKYAYSGNTYMRLVDITDAFDVFTKWDNDIRAAIIDTTKPAEKGPVTPPPTAPPGDGRGNTSGNLINRGYIAPSGDRIYYANRTIFPEGDLTGVIPDATLCSMKTDGSDRKQICEDNPWCINVVGDRIYYLNNNDSDRPYSIKTDGTDRKKLSEDGYLEGLTVADGRIYYCNENRKIYSMNLDGSDRKELYGGYSGNLNVAGGRIYYTSDNAICGMNTDGTGRTTLSSGSESNMIVSDDRIYYIGGNTNYNKLCSMKTDGTDNKLLTEDRVSSYNIAGDLIYYKVGGSDPLLCSIKTDGTGRRELRNDAPRQVYSISLAGDRLYCDGVDGDWLYWFYSVKTDGTDRQAVQ